MPELHTLALFLSAGLALNLTPGPDMLYVAARSSGEGRAAGLVSALGIATGCLFHITALALGLSALLATVPALYDALRVLNPKVALFFRSRPRSLALAQRATGAIFIGLGLRLAVSGRR